MNRGPPSPPSGGSPVRCPPGSGEMLRCPSCRLHLWEPVTVSCGHSLCTPCLGGAVPARCPLCQEKLKLLGVGGPRRNVVLCSLLEKCEDQGGRLAGLVARVRHHLTRGEAKEALGMAQKGVELAPDDTSLRRCRAEAFVALGQYPEALEDLEAVCKAEPTEHEGFFRKGKVLLEMGRRTEALLAWEHCLTLCPHFQPAQSEMEKILAQEDAPWPRAAHRCSTGPQAVGDGGDPASSSAGAQDQEGEPEAGRGAAVSEHGQGTPTQGRQQEPGAAAERQHRLLAGNEEEAEAAKCNQLYLGELLSISDLECSLCIRMFLEPVTTPCGHTFCKECLERCLDHRPNCPLCKQSLREYLKAGSYSCTVLLQDIMLATFPAQLAERRELHQAEMAELSNLTKNIPIFVCTMSFPGIACPLHVFEPRYRLMIRQCQETGTRRFGMCVYETGKSFADYGCMLQIRQLELLADGRSLVDTVGGRRFRVLRRGHRDGYNTADIEYLEDKKVAGEELQELQSLHESTYELAQRFCEHGDVASRHLLMQHGPLPEKEEDIQGGCEHPRDPPSPTSCPITRCGSSMGLSVGLGRVRAGTQLAAGRDSCKSLRFVWSAFGVRVSIFSL
ncbi:LON peptidase N-terminal domain and RING finger protein 1-like isoform X2 [Cygnus atratus]|uniref:LON peptidase N-terminal domain and RING finger protein 1-like isoform X2 n=1 Tax=Cygnus atratus TaxID=8868 RepID=UPI0015D585C8|nr:LON peptidase N-terminal domain and RING finger protein 1-like isoform X2 [Cygnus atratus]